MSTLTKYNLAGKKLGDVAAPEALLSAEANSQMIKDYIVALQENLRQWTAHTKGRSEVKHSTKKSRPQKGTGGARHGSLVAPQFRGGGVAFGPKTKDIHTRINKKEKRAAIRFLLGEKMRSGNVVVVDSFSMQEPKTAALAKFLKALSSSGRALFIGDQAEETIQVGEAVQKVSVHSDKHEALSLSVRNLPKAEFSLAPNISGYDVLLANQIVVSEEALNQLVKWLA